MVNLLKIIPSLLISGLIGGLVSYFVNFKNLRLSPEPKINLLTEGDMTEISFWGKAYEFIRVHWEFFAYIIIGVAGAMLVPLVDALIDGLKGLPNLRIKSNDITPWETLILFGYGFVFAYGSNKFFISIIDLILGRITSLNTPPPTNQKNLLIIKPATIGEHKPNVAEVDATASGPFNKVISRGSDEFKNLQKNENPKIVFKSEEPNPDDDKMMTQNLKEKVDELADLVEAKWGVTIKLRIVEAWDGQMEHSSKSLHYEARAVDITTSDKDSKKLGDLFDLAVTAGFDWVWYEDALHIHASVKK
ncbi:hypothetical protein VB796_21590 [Arcicella sp. LKC2W]|uniref:hypothetical protein n=1 Tax=Arcicella sp. LKC2W TaxID=2984198 RepID=UPI002B1F49FF|nr:hypothetical protein [Arcicella sp. LKC2W]MEA5461676.1 hypothetical protein [Arcicella sp. LKC2W]